MVGDIGGRGLDALKALGGLKDIHLKPFSDQTFHHGGAAAFDTEGQVGGACLLGIHQKSGIALGCQG